MSVSRYYLIGPTPPPLGGVSVHIGRLSRKLQSEGKTVVNVDVAGSRGIRKAWALARMMLDPRFAEFQIHAFDFSAMAALVLRPFRKRLTYMDHGTPLYKRKLEGIRKALFARILKRADEVVFVSEAARDYYVRAEFELTPSVTIRSAFLPPPVEDEARVLAEYPAETMEFIRTRSPLLVANASQLLFYNDIDLYGLDLCVELIGRLQSRYPRVGMLFAVGNADMNREYLEKTRKQLREKSLSDNFEFLTGQREVWPAFRRADLMVRPTSNDGYAISLEEAIFCGCATLASDAAVRPPETVTFTNRDIDDFERKALEILSGMPLKANA